MKRIIVFLLFLTLIVAGFYFYKTKILPQKNYCADVERNFGFDCLIDCKVQNKCGDMVMINCKAEVDGPIYYVNTSVDKIVGYCGGYCFGPKDDKYCRKCPPTEWTCGN